MAHFLRLEKKRVVAAVKRKHTQTRACHMIGSFRAFVIFMNHTWMNMQDPEKV